MKYLAIFSLLITSVFSYAQEEYSAEKLQQFTDLYLKAKVIKVDNDFNHQALLKSHNISSKRYRQILHLSLVDEMPELSENELNFINDLKSENAKHERNKQKALNEFLNQHNFDIQLYKALVEKYKSDMKFQRRLKPFFDSSLARN